MRNFSKTLISMAAVMAVGSAMAAGAMAETLTATYVDTDSDKVNDSVSISGVTAGKSQYTLLVVQGTTAEGATEVTYDANESTIKQIDQNDEGVAFTSAVVGTLADGSYKVLVGNNDGTVDSGIFTVSSAPQVQYEDIVIGDVDTSGKVNATDYGYILTYVKRRNKANPIQGTDYYTANTAVTRTTADGTHAVGDVDASGKVNATDYGYILTYVKRRNKANPIQGTDYYTANTASTVSVVVE